MPRRGGQEALTLVENNPSSEERRDGIDTIYKGVLDLRLRAEKLLEKLIEQDPSLIEAGPDGKIPAQKLRGELEETYRREREYEERKSHLHRVQ